jgi:hypothetical protein
MKSKETTMNKLTIRTGVDVHAPQPALAPEKLRYPPVITRSLIKKIVDAVRKSCYFDVACEAAGVDEATGLVWIREGEQALEALEDGGRPAPEEVLYLEFVLAVRKAEALAELQMVVAVMKHSRNWQGAAWILSRKNFHRWGDR